MISLSTLKARIDSMQGFFVALLTVLLLSSSRLALAQTNFVNDLVITSGVSGGGDFTRSFYTNNPNGSGATSGQYQGNYLGTFTIDNTAAKPDRFILDAIARTVASGGDNVQQPQLLYRIYRSNNPNLSDDLGSFIGLPLALSSGSSNSSAEWSSLGNSPRNTLDVLSLIDASDPNATGQYTLQLQFRAPVQNSGQGVNAISDDNGGKLYAANFYVTVNQENVKTLSWNTAKNDGNWFNAANWIPAPGSQAGVPDPNTDVTIQFVSGGSYPTIGDASQTALVRNLRLTVRNSLSAQLIVNTNLRIFGNVTDTRAGIKQTGGVITLAGTSQSYDGFPQATLGNLEITGGGSKTFTNNITISQLLRFTATSSSLPAGLVQTSGNFAVILQNTAAIAAETEGAYVSGLTTATRSPTLGVTNTFGSIGLGLNVRGNNAGDITVMRTTEAYRNDIQNAEGITRGFVVSTNNADITNYDVYFYYLNDLLNNISPNNLVLFRSDNGDIPFTNLMKTGPIDQTNKIVARTNILNSENDLNGLFTLGDQTRPLPVTLASFTATGTAQGAALKWITASELNNKGFGVERQVAGATTWESVGYVTGTNAANGSSYSFLDKTIPSEATQVYYRLRQEDKTGELTYSPVAAISRAAAGAELTLSPVPLDSNPLLVSFAEAGQAGAVIEVVNMQGQRVGRFASEGSSEGVSLPLNHLAPGVYIVNVQVPGQAIRHARFVKQ
jgi:hypothetical protein